MKPWIATLYLNYLSKDKYAENSIKNLSIFLGRSVKYGNSYHTWKTIDRYKILDKYIGSIQEFINKQ